MQMRFRAIKTTTPNTAWSVIKPTQAYQKKFLVPLGTNICVHSRRIEILRSARHAEYRIPPMEIHYKSQLESVYLFKYIRIGTHIREGDHLLEVEIPLVDKVTCDVKDPVATYGPT